MFNQKCITDWIASKYAGSWQMLGVYSGVGAARMGRIHQGARIYAFELAMLAKYLGCRMDDLWIKEAD